LEPHTLGVINRIQFVAELALYPGTPIVIERIGSARYIEEQLQGRIETADPSHLTIILPAPLTKLLPLEIGAEIQLKASLPEGMYRFEGRILERGKTGFTIPYPFSTTRLQRREQRRIGVDGIVIFALRDAPAARPSYGKVVDISIGGLQLQSEKWLPAGANLELEFNLHDGLRGAAIGLIRWKKEAAVNSAEARTYCYGVKFVHIEEQLRQQIAAYIRERERAMLGTMAEANASVPAN
jgi:c-di-GMP-binding flagellar brake protein YcgR